METRSSAALATAATVLVGIAIAVLTLMPVPTGAPGSDKLYHVLAFAALAFPMSTVRAAFATGIFLAVCGYGGLIELVQPFFGRSAEWSDLWADAVGAALGTGAGVIVGSAWRKRTAGASRGRGTRLADADRSG